MQNRRLFLQKTSALTLGAFSINSLFNQLHAKDFEKGDVSLLDEDDFWAKIQLAYTANNTDIIILNNGGVSPSPLVVQQALDKYNKIAAQGPSYHMWRVLDKGREPLRERLAALAGCSAEEVAINRNATEALNTVIFGLPLQKGDEVIGTAQDYPNMMQAWKQRQQRDGIVYKQLSFEFPIENDEQIVSAYEAAITPNTKLLHVTHIVNWVGQIMPVKKICAMAHKRGIEVLVDGAHSFGLLNFSVSDLGCDYFGTSLHKFLCGPVGSGMLVVKKEKIAKIWPLLGSPEPLSDNIRKFETLGTRSFCIEQAVGEAINFHEAIGTARKQERIHLLKTYWAEKALQIPKVKLHTSLKPEYSCAIAGVSIEGITAQRLDQLFFTNYKIHTTPINIGNIHCVRVTPNIYTRKADLDKLVTALGEIAAG